MSKKVTLRSNQPYRRPSRPIEYSTTLRNVAGDLAGTIRRHLYIRLDGEFKYLKSLYVKCKVGEPEFINWYTETEAKKPDLVEAEVARLNKKGSKVKFCTDEGKAIVGEILLNNHIKVVKKNVIDLRKSLGLEYLHAKDDEIILTNGIENSDIFRIFGSPLTFEQLKKSYKRLAKEHHPDRGGSEEVMAAISKLYKKLEDKWDTYDPANLTIPESKLKSALAKKFEDPVLIALLEK